MKRWLRLLLILPLVLVVIIGFLVGTESGLRFVVSQARYWSPGNLAVGQLEGKLLGPLVIREVNYHAQAVDLVVDSMELRWKPSSLLRGTLEIDKLHVDGVRYKTLKTATAEKPAAEPFVLPEKIQLPVNINISDVRLSDLTFTSGPQADPFYIESVELGTTYANSNDADITLKVKSDMVDVEGSLVAGLSGDYPLDGLISWQLRLPSYNPIVGETNLSGSLKHVEIQQTIAPPYSITASAILHNPLDKLSINTTVNLATSDLSRISREFPPYGINGELNFAGPITNGIAAADVTVSGVLSKDIKGTLDLKVKNQILLLDALQVDLEGSPLQIMSSGVVNLTDVSKPVVDAEVQWTSVEWPLDGEPMAISDSGRLRLDGDPDNLSVSVDAAIGAAGHITGSGELKDRERIDSVVKWQNVAWPNDGSQVSNVTGSIRIDGTVDDYRLRMSTTADTPQVSQIKASVSGIGSKSELLLPSINVQAIDGTLDGAVQVSWQSGLTFATSFTGNDFNPGIVSPDLSGNLDLTLAVTGTTLNDILSTQIHALTVNGVLKDSPVALTVTGGSYGEVLTLENASLSSGSTQFSAQGVVDDQLDVEWKLNSPDLSTLVPSASGQISGFGSLNGARTQPKVKIKLDGQNLGYPGYSLTEIAIDADIDSSPGGKAISNIKLRNGRAGTVELASFDLKSKGAIEAHEITAIGKSNQGNISVNVDGGLIEQAWSFTLNSANLSYPGLAAWSLDKPASGLISADKSVVSDACLISGNSRLCVNGGTTVDDLDIDYQLQNLAIGYFHSFLPESASIAGIIESTGSVKQTVGEPLLANVELTVNNGTVDVVGSENETVRVLKLNPSNFRLTSDENSVSLQGLVDLGKQGKINLGAEVAGQLDTVATGELSGRVSGSVQSFDFLADLIPEIEKSSGRLKMDISVDGSLEAPIVSGDLNFSDGAVSLITPGLDISSISAAITATDNNKLAIDMKAESGGGNLAINGIAALSADQRKVNLAITGDEFQVINSLEARAVVTPDMQLVLEGDQVRINGVLTIPTADITPKEIPAGVVQVSEDQIIVGEEAGAVTNTPLNVSGTVKIVLGEKVNVEAFGLKAGLSGEITAVESPGKETTARGRLDIKDGTFKAYGQKLQIQTGRIMFAGGPISQPGFDLDAVRKITTEIQVGVRARGAIDKPEFTLFSDPAMTETEQLSYLVLGRPLEENSPSENTAMTQAAMALGVAGGEFLTEKFGDKLGVDEIAIDSELRETGEQASLVVGKYLSPKLFVSYGVGLFEPVSTLRLKYSISKNIKLVTETTESKSGGDFVFTFERGQ